MFIFFSHYNVAIKKHFSASHKSESDFFYATRIDFPTKSNLENALNGGIMWMCFRRAQIWWEGIAHSVSWDKMYFGRSQSGHVYSVGYGYYSFSPMRFLKFWSHVSVLLHFRSLSRQSISRSVSPVTFSQLDRSVPLLYCISLFCLPQISRERHARHYAWRYQCHLS